MTRTIRTIAAVVILAAALVMAPKAGAGRIGGPTTMMGTVPAATSVYYDIPFAAGDQAVVTLAGNGNSLVFVLIYDSDGHVAIGNGRMDRRTAVMDVYRTGTFRVEVRNLGVFANNFTLTTN
jgi:hypothetical protein